MLLENKNILITGADGFIGSHLCEALLKHGCHIKNIKALVQYNSFNNWGWLEDVEEKNDIEVLSGDIRDLQYMKNICKNVDVVFHLAALIAIPYSYTAPESYVETNIKGTLNVCQAALENNVEKVLITSTSEVYGSALYVPIDEKHALQAQSPYSATKISADAIAQSFYNSFNLPLTIVRPFNTYGPRQSARAVIPTIITQICAGKKQIELGDTSPTRDFNYVKDICKAFIMLAQADNVQGEVINVGSNFEISVKETLELIKNIMQSDVEFVTDSKRLRPEKSEVQRLWCDNTKIKELINYTPSYTLEQGLKETVEWFSKKENLLKYKVDIYNV